MYDVYDVSVPIAMSLTYDGTYAEHDNEVNTRGFACDEYTAVEHHVDEQTPLKFEPGLINSTGTPSDGVTRSRETR